MTHAVPETLCGVRVTVARGFFARLLGLMGRRTFPEGEGMLFLRCAAIHTCFMRFPIDAVFLDDGFRPVKTVRNVPPWRPWIWGGRQARHVLETATRRDGAPVP